MQKKINHLLEIIKTLLERTVDTCIDVRGADWSTSTDAVVGGLVGARGEGAEFVTTSGTGLPNLNPLPDKSFIGSVFDMI